MATPNAKIASVLYQISEYLKMQNMPWKPRAYEKAAEGIHGMEAEVEEIYKKEGKKGLLKIPGVGQSIADSIAELLETGTVKYHEELKKSVPVNLSELRMVEGLGAKSIERLYRELGVKNLKDLERAAKAGKIAPLKGFGKKTEENILRGLAFAKDSGKRHVLGLIMPRIELLVQRLKKLDGVEHAEVAGSARRRKETVGDIDILVVANDPAKIMDYFVNMPEVVRVMGKGPTKSSVHLAWGLDADLRVVPRESYGAALLYFTGSKDHNVLLRSLALRQGFTLNEYGLYFFKKGVKGKMAAGKSEEDVYAALELDFIPPEMREANGEVGLAAEHKLPALINYGEVAGDLQVQTDWTDGSASIEDMAKAAIAQGLKYIAITDHTKRLAMTGGLDEKKLLKQMAEIDRLNKKYKGKITILKGTECDILKDGSMDIEDHVLSQLDLVGASVHSYFHLPKAEQTQRVLRAMQNPHVDILFHPTTRIINRREACELDMEEVIRQAKKYGTVLEIDSYPDRTDLKDEYIRKCVEAGVKMSIDSDAHAPQHFAFLEYGISQARRGWAARGDIINAWPVEEMRKFLKNGKQTSQKS